MATKSNFDQLGLFKKPASRMPEGYYFGDKPNPNLRTFVEQHINERPYNASMDSYVAEPFDKPITSKKATALYNIHAYWSKKPHDAIRQYIRHYTTRGDLVLDPMCGSGGTAVAACIEGRKCIAIDLSPAATFITSNYVRPLPPQELREAFSHLLNAFSARPESKLYDLHQDGYNGVILRTIYSARFRCSRCMEVFALFDCPTKEISKKSSEGSKNTTVCPNCLKRGIVEELAATSEYIDRIPVATEYRLGKRGTHQRKYNDSDKQERERFFRHDIGLIEMARKTPIASWFPDRYMMDVNIDNEVPWGLLWRPYHRGVRKVADLFTHRNLHVISALFECIQSLSISDDAKSVLRFALTAILPGLSFLNRYRPDVSFPLNYSANTLYIPPVGTEENPLPHLSNKVERIAKGYAELISYAQTPCFVSTQDACNLQNIPANSIDYVFTDPPYGYRIQYGELNFVWESWLKFSGEWRNREMIINESETRHCGIDHWTTLFKQAMAECCRVLKPGRWLSLCFHDSSTEMWQAVQDIMAEVGFIPDRLSNAVAIETDYHTHKQLVAKQIAKRDLIINFRKPKLGEVVTAISLTGAEDADTFNEKVHAILREFLDLFPGSTKDRIYDELVSRMVRSGQMEAHDFDALLCTVAEEVKTPVKKDLYRNGESNILGTHEIGRWYLKETELVVADAAETGREDVAASGIGVFMTGHVDKHPGEEGVHYSDLFEYYICAIKDKPRRQLADFLPDYFYKTEQGTWRLPSSEEEERAKREARVKGLGRRVKRYIAQLEQGVIIPDHEQPNDATLAEWIRHCKRAGLYEQGKLLYEKGGLNPDNLAEEAMVKVEEDYQVCVRMLVRNHSAAPVKKSKRMDV